MNAAIEFSLDDLLNESMDNRKKELKVKENRTRLSMGNLHPEAAAKLQAENREHDMKVSWTVKANVASFNRQTCNACGCYTCQTEGLFLRQTHKQTKADRWVRVPMEQLVKGEFAVETLYHDSEVEMCEECCKEAGFPIED